MLVYESNTYPRYIFQSDNIIFKADQSSLSILTSCVSLESLWANNSFSALVRKFPRSGQFGRMQKAANPEVIVMRPSTIKIQRQLSSPPFPCNLFKAYANSYLAVSGYFHDQLDDLTPPKAPERTLPHISALYRRCSSYRL